MASDSQSKIVAQARVSALADKCSTRSAAEHTIWRSEMRLKRASGEHGHGAMKRAEPCSRHVSSDLPKLSFFSNLITVRSTVTAFIFFAERSSATFL